MRQTSPSHSLTVLVSVRIDPVSARPTRSRADAATLALACHALGAGGPPQVCTAGPLPDAVAREYLAQGVPALQRLAVPEDTLAAVATALAAHCRDQALVLTSARGESGLATGLLPHVLAERLQRPLLADVIDLQAQPDGGWRVVQALPRGARRAWLLAPGAPAVLVTSPRLAQREDLPLRHAWLAAQQGRLMDRPVAAPGAAAPVHPVPPWQAEPSRRQRRVLSPPATESGAARMARATGTAAPARQAGQLLRGTPAEQARALLDHLRRLALVPGPDAG
jgi:electron transfer flavoprotein beta subunit